MGFFSSEMAPMLEVFTSETSELMGSFGEVLARVEQNDRFGDDDIGALFRYAHTTKGSSAMMGLEGLSTLTHRVEDLFDTLRGDSSLADGHVADLIDHLYEFCDFVGDELVLMPEDDYRPKDASPLVDVFTSDIAKVTSGYAVQAETDGASLEEPPQSDAEAPTEAEAAAGLATMRVDFKANVPMVNVRAMVIVRQVSARTGLASYVPTDLSAPDAEQAVATEGLLLSLPYEDVEVAKELLGRNSFVRNVTMLSNKDQASPGEAAGDASTKDAPSSSGAGLVSTRWTSIHELQDLAGEFLLEMARLKDACADSSSNVRMGVTRLSHLVDDLVFKVDSMAMMNAATLAPKLSRLVRDMCRKSGKKVQFTVHGGEIEVDRNLYSSISEPLLHIMRNAVDHGIEPPDERVAAGKSPRGNITLTIEDLGGRVLFRVQDDGRGMDPKAILAKAREKGLLTKPASHYSQNEALQLILLPGFSTTESVSAYSGRGVGMDVVSKVVQDFGGRLEISSEPGKGTSFMLFMPVSATSVHCLSVLIGCHSCFIPLTNLDKVLTAQEVEGQLVQHEEGLLLEYDERLLPVLNMFDVFGCEGTPKNYVICHNLNNQFVICMDKITGELEVATKHLPSCLNDEWQMSVGIRNAVMCEDGSVGYALNTALLEKLVQQVWNAAEPTETTHGPEAETKGGASLGASGNIPNQLLVFELGKRPYAVDVRRVKRIVPAAECSAVPKGLPWLLGLIGHRNHVVPIFDLVGAASGARDAARVGDYPHLVVMEDRNKELVALAVSSVVGVRQSDAPEPADEQPAPRELACGLQATTALQLAPKEPVVTLVENLPN
ncbi:MAG: chemotaxis protein CheW [Coriobacteriales bacterium]|nr:chemotaxis protein CheW [Coriobacteriales bacterium]